MCEREVEKIPTAESCDKRGGPNPDLDTLKEADGAKEVLK